MTTINLLKQTGRAAVLALVLAGSALGAAAPAQAAPPSNFSLDVQPQGDAKTMQQFNQKSFSPDAFFNWCLTDKQIRRGLQRYGFEDVQIVNYLSRNRVRVEAIWDDWVYQMRVNRCTGQVDRIKPLYPVWEDDDWGPWDKKGPGKKPGLHFN